MGRPGCSRFRHELSGRDPDGGTRGAGEGAPTLLHHASFEGVGARPRWCREPRRDTGALPRREVRGEDDGRHRERTARGRAARST